MSKTTTTMRWTTVALLAGALTLPGLAPARDDDGHRGDWDHYGDWDDRGHKEGHWRHHHHGHYVPRRYGRRVVVVREPVYVEPRPAVVAPLWPSSLGINLVLPLH